MAFQLVVVLPGFVVLAVWLLPFVSEVLTVLSRRSSGRTPSPPPVQGQKQRMAFLVPAHNERDMIEQCVRSLCAMHRTATDHQLFVVADNCTDDTADLARGAGAEVLERTDHANPGKPQAIQWALNEIGLDGWDAVVVVDADTTVCPEFADELASGGPLRKRAAQAYFDISNKNESWLSILGTMLALIRYEGQYPLKQRAGLNVPLTGNGMCLGTDVLTEHGWADDSLTENWEMYARYTAAGVDIGYERGARLYSVEATTLSGGMTQRRRWQAGRLGVARRYLHRIVGSRTITIRQKIDSLAELVVPGPVLHGSIAAIATVVFLAIPSTATRVLAAGFAVSVVPSLSWTAWAWWKQPDRARALAAMARAPVYALWRIVAAVLSLGTAKRGTWLRSPRPTSKQGTSN